MKIVILTDSSDRHFYFCNRIIGEYDSVVGVFLGTKQKSEGFFAEIKKLFRRKIFLKAVINKLLNLIFLSYGKKFHKEKLNQEKLIFGGSEDLFYQHQSNFFCDTVSSSIGSINHKFYIDKIKSLEPDVIIVMGSCLIRREIISIAKYIINMHTGLSPYYRGGYTNLWPILNDDYGYFGVTVHTMSSGIDSGEIVYTARPNISLEDNYGSINAKAIILGSDLIVATIKHIKDDDLTTKKQWLHGNLFHNHHFNNYIAYKYFKKRRDYINKFCELAQKNKLDNVVLVKNGELQNF
ncbi:formyltransferase family protein [Pseudomonadales bacterium]|nr:formyltransferase family protein [Pseudomonadales bacterium]